MGKRLMGMNLRSCVCANDPQQSLLAARPLQSARAAVRQCHVKLLNIIGPNTGVHQVPLVDVVGF